MNQKDINDYAIWCAKQVEHLMVRVRNSLMQS